VRHRRGIASGATPLYCVEAVYGDTVYVIKGLQ
jgi:hypothetical protein